MASYETTTLYADTFVENIVGTVASPDNALGTPSTTYTQNATGSWTARWRLQSFDGSGLYHERFDLNIRVRASDSFLPAPRIKSVKLLAVNGASTQEYEFKAFLHPSNGTNYGVELDSQYWLVSNLVGTETGKTKSLPITVLGEAFERGGEVARTSWWPKMVTFGAGRYDPGFIAHATKPIFAFAHALTMSYNSVVIVDLSTRSVTEEELPLDYDFAPRVIGSEPTTERATVAISPDGNVVACTYFISSGTLKIIDIGSDYQSIQSVYSLAYTRNGVTARRFITITLGNYVVTDNSGDTRSWYDYNQTPPVLLETPPVTFPDDSDLYAPFITSSTGEYVWMNQGSGKLYRWNSGSPELLTLPVTLSGSWPTAIFSPDDSEVYIVNGDASYPQSHLLLISGSTVTLGQTIGGTYLATMPGTPLWFNDLFTKGRSWSGAASNGWQATPILEAQAGTVTEVEYLRNSEVGDTVSTPYPLIHDNLVLLRHSNSDYFKVNSPSRFMRKLPLAASPEQATDIDLTLRGQFDHYRYEGNFALPSAYLHPYNTPGDDEFWIYPPDVQSETQVQPAWSPDGRYVAFNNYYRTDTNPTSGYTRTSAGQGSAVVVYDTQSGTPVLHPVSYISLEDIRQYGTVNLAESAYYGIRSRLVSFGQDGAKYYLVYEYVVNGVITDIDRNVSQFCVIELEEVNETPTYTLHKLPTINQYIIDQQQAAEDVWGHSYSNWGFVYSPSRPLEICEIRNPNVFSKNGGAYVHPYHWPTDTVLSTRHIPIVVPDNSTYGDPRVTYTILDTAKNTSWFLFKAVHRTTNLGSNFADSIGVINYATGQILSYRGYFSYPELDAAEQGGGGYMTVSAGKLSPDLSMVALVQDNPSGVQVFPVSSGGFIDLSKPRSQHNQNTFSGYTARYAGPSWLPKSKGMLVDLGRVMVSSVVQDSSEGFYIFEYDKYRRRFYRDTERFFWYKSGSPGRAGNLDASPTGEWVVNVHRKDSDPIKFYKMEYRPPLDLGSELYVEIETEDVAGSAVQVSAISLTLYDDFKVFAPRNLATGSVSSSGALTSWEWDPLYEDE